MNTEPEKPQGGSSFWLRHAALGAILVGAVGSLVFLFRARQHPPPFLLALFVVWVLAPFVALAIAEMISKRWSILTQRTLYSMMMVLALGTLAVYGDDSLSHRTAHAAFVYVLVPPVSVVLLAIALSIAAAISGRRSRRSDNG